MVYMQVSLLLLYNLHTALISSCSISSPKLSMENSTKHTMLVGPWGGEEGFYWDDGVYSTIRQLEIAHGAGIDSIKIEYDMKGKSVWSEKHGGLGGFKLDKVRLEYPDEYLTLLHGHCGSLQERGPIIVRSLTFETNKRKYGPFGVQEGTYFTSKMHGKIVGFVGKCGWYLDSVGVYIEPLHKPTISNLDPLHNKPIISNSMYHSQHNVAQGTEKYEYSMIQGNLGKNFDLIVAVRQKDDDKKSSPIFNRTGQISHGHDQPKNEVASVVPSKHVKGLVKSGPWGGHGGSPFDDGVYDGIRQINVSRNVAIVSIRVCYDKNGEPVWGSKNGGTGSIKSDKVAFDYPSEKITHLTGYHGPTMIMGPNVIKSLTFHTTKAKYGPYGEEEGEFFSTKSKEGSVILGLHGRKGLFVDAIGVHMIEGNVVPGQNTHSKDAVVSSISNAKQSKPNSQTAPPNNIVDHKVNNNSEWSFKMPRRGHPDQEVVQRLVKNPAPYGAGPWGGEGGKAWDDGVFSAIKQIIVTKTDAICCIEFEYDRNGQSVWSVKHGGNGGQTANRVKLEYPNEVLTCISGYYGPIKKEQGANVIQSLTFHTSRRKYGPFGEEIGTYFASGTTEGKVVGFHGRSSVYLDAIGVHMQHWLGNQKGSKHASLMKIFS
ncbi:jacalin-related lectin 3 [Phtheirospermum japonicum]|uniref:Jacalin-related lectin 3 n=1 Tax=Phtheirospermum japonicum TaxID=374723 RepID=A0A830DGP0_9LAMI|nr:jacalin-related lectin 3 [Phtheirospermum japonicum]